jgi:hypothetical protein
MINVLTWIGVVIAGLVLLACCGMVALVLLGIVASAVAAAAVDREESRL